MVPRQDLFGGKLALIRPLSFLDKGDIYVVAENLAISPVRTVCPVSEKTRRRDIRQFLDLLYREIPDSKMSIFTALSNVRHEYLLYTMEDDVARRQGEMILMQGGGK